MNKTFVLEKLFLIKSVIADLRNDKNIKDSDEAYFNGADSAVDILAKQLGVFKDFQRKVNK